MNKPKHTKGPVSECSGFIIGTFSDGKVHDICDPRCAPAEPGLMAEMDANTALIIEAFNVTHETGLTPRQLMEQNRALVEAAEKALKDLECPAAGNKDHEFLKCMKCWCYSMARNQLLKPLSALNQLRAKGSK